MVKLGIIGKSDILEKIAWCKKYSSYKEEESDGLKNAQLIIKGNIDIMVATTDSALDSYDILPKLKPLGFKLPTSDEFELLYNVLLKDFTIYTLFAMLELVPGRPDYEYGVGFCVESNNIFFEEKIYKTVDVVQKEKVLGGLFTKKTTQKKRVVKKMGDLFGKDFQNDMSQFIPLKFEKDNRENKRFSARCIHNLIQSGKDAFKVNKLGQRWSNEATFFNDVTKACQMLEIVINQVYTIIGYETAPDFIVLLGEIDPDRKIGELVSEDMNGTPVIDVKYQ